MKIKTTIQNFCCLALLYFAAQLFIGCSKNAILKDSGSVRTELRTVATIHEIILHDKINLILTHDSIQTLMVEAGSNLIAGIRTSLSGSTLTISNENKSNWVRDDDKPVNVYISSSTVDKIQYFGAGTVTSTNELVRKKFVFESIEGVGSVRLKLRADETELIIKDFNTDLTVEGSATINHVYCAGTGTMNLTAFKVNFTFLDYRSIKDSYLFINDFVMGSIFYKGNVYYKGDPPTIRINHTNTGKLIKLN